MRMTSAETTRSWSVGCDQRIKSLIGPSSSRFAGGHRTGQFGGTYACEQAQTRANCN